jgi:ketosteroid isomerase-like protein
MAPSRAASLIVEVSMAFLLLLVTMLTGSAPAARPLGGARFDDARSADQAQIRAVLDAQVEAWNRADVASFMQGYWNSPETEFVGASGITRGWQRVCDRYRKAYPDRAAMGHLDFSGLEITMLGSDAALVVGQFHLGRQNDAPQGVFTLIFRKFPEGWRIIHDHTSQTSGQVK